MFNLLCPDAIPSFFNFFDFSIAPILLFYSYVPVVLVSLFLGFFIYLKSENKILGKLLFLISILFSLWVFAAIITWTAVYAGTVHFSWQIISIIEMSIYVLAIYFVYVFFNKKDLGFLQKFLLFLVSLPVIIALPTRFNEVSFDLINCQSQDGLIWFYIYGFEIISIIIILLMAFKKIFKEKIESSEKTQFILLTIGITLFLGIFTATNILGNLTDLYEINLVGPIGMVVFLAFLSYMIVKFKTFNIRVLATQVLIISLVILVGSQFFFIQNNTNRILTAITLIASIWLGIAIIRSVMKEIELRSRIELLARDLDKLNRNLVKSNSDLEVANEKLKELDQLKSEFVSLATHQIRGPLTAIKGYLSMVFEGDFGKISPQLMESLRVVYTSTESLIGVVGDFLNVSRIEQGQMKYDMTKFSLNDLVKEVVEEQKPNIQKKGLELKVDIIEATCLVNADRLKAKQVIANLLDNSIKYTEKGWVAVSLKKTGDKGEKVLMEISDSGVGISKDTMPHLFEKFSRAKDAYKTNILGTGLGLYVARKMMEVYKGRIWAESEGSGKGSQFYVELEVVK